MPSHGSLTKAGKVRKQTPKIPAKPRKNPAPRIRNRIEHRRLAIRMQQGATSRRRR